MRSNAKEYSTGKSWSDLRFSMFSFSIFLLRIFREHEKCFKRNNEKKRNSFRSHNLCWPLIKLITDASDFQILLNIFCFIFFRSKIIDKMEKPFQKCLFHRLKAVIVYHLNRMKSSWPQ